MENEKDDESYLKSNINQFLVFFFVSFSWTVSTGWYGYVFVFAAYAPEHTCDLSSLTDNSSLLMNYTINEDQCTYTDNLTDQSYSCDKWTYDDSEMKSTIITEYNFVCDRNYIFETAYTVEQLGYLVGTLFFSIIADYIGRRPVLLWISAGMTIVGIAEFFVTNFYAYMSLGFILNILASGPDAVCVPYILEIVSTKRRTVYGIGMEYLWVLILTPFSLFAYLINSWRYLRLFVFITMGVITILTYFFVKESERWQRSVNKKVDDKNTQVDEILAEEKGSFKDIIKHPRYRVYVIIMSLNWFSTGVIYDGLTYLNSFVGENIFINWTLMNIIELPGQVICHFSLLRFGRRYTTCVSLLLCGIFLVMASLVTAFASDDLNWLKLILFLIAKCASTCAYSAVILHSAEIFPTHIRSIGNGICSFADAITTIVAPIVSLYLSKIIPWLPPVIYGVIAIPCGILSLYVPETLNRQLPSTINDVLSWSRNLSPEEWKKAKELSKIDWSFLKKFKAFLCRKRSVVITPSS